MVWTIVRNGVALVTFFLIGAALGLALRPSVAAPTADTAAEAPETAWPAPSQDSIDYLASIDLRTMQPHIPENGELRYDLIGIPLAPDVRVHVYSYGFGYHTAIAPDGKWVATGGGACDGPVGVSDLSNGQGVYRMLEGRGTTLFALGFTPDSGKVLAAAKPFVGSFSTSYGWELTVLDLATGVQKSCLLGERHVTAVAFSGDATRAAVADREGIVEFWNLAEGIVEDSWDVGATITLLATSANGQRTAVRTAPGAVQVFDRVSHKTKDLPDAPKDCRHLSFSPDGRVLLIGAERILFFDVVTGRVWPLRVQERWQQGDCAAFSPDGRTLATHFFDRRTALEEVNTGLCRQLLGTPITNPWGGSAFLPDFDALLAGLVVWDLGKPPARAVDALNADDLERLWKSLGEPEASLAYDAVQMLAARPTEAVPFLAARLTQTEMPPPVDRIPSLIRDLDNKDFKVREAASFTLAQMGSAPIQALQETRAAKPSLELAQRLDQLLDRLKLADGCPQHLGVRRTIEVLEKVGNAAARRVLEDIAKQGPDAECRADARASLQRLDHVTPRAAAGALP